MEIDAKSLQLLMEAGMLAAGYGYMPESETIFEGLKAVRPESESPLIGLAFTKMSTRQVDEAIRILDEQALKINPDSDLARAFLGLAYKLAGRGELSDSMVNQVLDSNRDPAAVNLAKSIQNGLNT